MFWPHSTDDRLNGGLGALDSCVQVKKKERRKEIDEVGRDQEQNWREKKKKKEKEAKRRRGACKKKEKEAKMKKPKENEGRR